MDKRFLLTYHVFNRYQWRWEDRKSWFDTYDSMATYINELKKGTKLLLPEDVKIEGAFELKKVDLPVIREEELMTIKRLKNTKEYSFECEMNAEEYNPLCKGYQDEYDNVCDEWGCAIMWFGNIGVEYNFCIDNSTLKNLNLSAIYKTDVDDQGYMRTDPDKYIHYEINFDDADWKEKLEDAMCAALIKFHGL